MTPDPKQQAQLVKDDPRALDGWKESREEVAAVVAASKTPIEVVDAATEEAATDMIAEAKGAIKAAENRRLAATKPHRETTDAINAAFKELLAPLGGIVKALEDQVLGYRRREQEREAEERRAAEEAERQRVEEERRRLEENARKRQEEEDAKAAAEGREAKQVKPFEIADPEPPPAPSGRHRKSRVTSGGTRGTTVDNWKFEVVDLLEVPDDYCRTVADEVAIKTAIDNGVREIPGVRIYNDAHLAVSR